MKLLDYQNYFESAAKRNKILAHKDPLERIAFKTFDIEDIISGVAIDLKNICLFAENPQTRVGDELSDNPRKIYVGAYLIMEPCQDPGDYKKIQEIYQRTEEVAEQVLAKIWNDAKCRNSNRAHPFAIEGFNLPSVNAQTVGPVFNGWYGWRTSFSINQTFTNNLILNEDDWIGEKRFSIR